MDEQARVAIHESAQDYFVRSKSIARRRALMEGDTEREKASWPEVVELGWPGMLAPEERGGLALDLAAAAEVMRAAGAHVAPEPLLAVAGLSSMLLSRLDSAPAHTLLEALIEGRALPALAWQEDAGDLDAVPLVTGADLREGGGVVLHGEKLLVLPGTIASGWIVSARCDDTTVLLWVPRGTDGVIETPVELADGSSASALRFNRVMLESGALLAQGEPAQAALRYAVAAGQILLAAELLGVGQTLLALTCDYLGVRTQFGRPIGSFQALQHRCVDMYIHLEVAQAVLTEVLAIAADPALPLAKLEAAASRVKARCTAAALQASRSAVQLHGAIGYTLECDVSLFYRRTLCLSAWLGNATIHHKRCCALADTDTATSKTDDRQWDRPFPRNVDWSEIDEDDFRLMVRTYLRQNYPDKLRYLSHRARWAEIKDWYITLSKQGWIAPAWPKEHGGMGLPADKLIAWIEEFEQYGVARAPDQGIVMVGPLLIQHGSREQQERFLPRILSGKHIWCQGYSEPNAGSDLASLRTEAVRGSDADGEHFIVNGQKIWTTLAQDANHIFLLVRTDKEAKKQEGISFLLVDLFTPGITIRPIRTLANEEEFCEVFFENVRVPAENLVGKLNGGWTIAKALLGFERIFLGSPKQSQYALGQLSRLAQARQLTRDPVFMQRYTALRLDVADLSAAYSGFAQIVKAGKPLPPSVSLLKIWASETYHRIGALIVEASDEFGAQSGDQMLDGQPFNALSPLIGSTSAMIYGGTNEIQRNILARQVLGLPG